MTLTNNFIESFIKSVGKSSGIVFIVGTVAGVYYVTKSTNLLTRKASLKQNKNTQTDFDQNGSNYIELFDALSKKV
jgi:hypothetical protein